jgi:hypothetical protein
MVFGCLHLELFRAGRVSALANEVEYRASLLLGARLIEGLERRLVLAYSLETGLLDLRSHDARSADRAHRLVAVREVNGSLAFEANSFN